MSAQAEQQEGRTRLRELAHRYVPIFEWLPKYQRGWLRPDAIAALVVWAVLVPQAIAYATLAGASPEAGLYAAAAGLLFYAVLGTGRQVTVGPGSTISVMVAVTVAPLASSTGDYVTLTAALAILIGVILVGAGLARLALIADFFAKPILVGFVAGLALLIAVGQGPKLFGVEGGGDNFFEELWNLVMDLSDTNPETLAIGAGCIVMLFGLSRLVPSAPAALITVVAAIAAVAILDLDDEGVAVVGDIPTGLPTPNLPGVGLRNLWRLLPGAAGIAIVAFAESNATARSLADKHKYEVDPNQELIALGGANVGAGLFQGFPVDASLSRSATADAAGMKTQVSSLVALALVLITIVALSSLFRNLAVAALAAIIIVSVVGLVNVGELRRLYRLDKPDFALAIISLTGVLLLGILPGLAVAVVAGLAALVYRGYRPHTAVLGGVTGEEDEDFGFRDVERHSQAETFPGLIIFRFDTELFFANANYFRDQIREVVKGAQPPARAILVDAGAISHIDTTGTDMLAELVSELSESNIELLLARVKGPVRDIFRRTGLEDAFGGDRIYPTVRAGVAAYLARHGGAEESTDQPTDDSET
ncbi:MAG: sulfate permease [Chloroflexi bacterium]|nr:sulfate permease [Chloroflexota bacterium]